MTQIVVTITNTQLYKQTNVNYVDVSELNYTDGYRADNDPFHGVIRIGVDGFVEYTHSGTFTSDHFESEYGVILEYKS